MAKCEHDVGCVYGFYGEGRIVTENDIWEIIKDHIDYLYNQGMINFKKRNYFAEIEELSEMIFFDYCPWCACDISEKNIKSRVYDRICEYVKNLDKDKFAEIVKQIKIQKEEQEIKDRKYQVSRNAGYVYIMRMGEYHKIGMTKNINQRYKGINTMPERIELIYSEKVFDYTKVEKELHKMYSNKNKSGEWFSLAEQDIEDIKKYLQERKYEE